MFAFNSAESLSDGEGFGTRMAQGEPNAPPKWLYTTRLDDTVQAATAASEAVRTGSAHTLELRAHKERMAAVREGGGLGLIPPQELAIRDIRGSVASRTPYASRYSERGLSASMPDPRVRVRAEDFFAPPERDRGRTPVPRTGFRGSLLPPQGAASQEEKLPTDLAELAKSGPLQTLRGLVLRNANAKARKPERGRPRKDKVGSPSDLLVPGTTGSAILPPSWNEAEYDAPREEIGVDGISRILPTRLRPSEAMKRFSMFTMPPNRIFRPKQPTSSLPRSPAQEDLRTRLEQGPYGTIIDASSRMREDEPFRVEDLELSSPMAVGVSAPTSISTTGEVGDNEHGVSAANRKGIVDPAQAFQRQGTGMIRGTLTTVYEFVREVTAEAKKWSTVEDIKYHDAEVVFRVTLLPHYFDAFVSNLRAVAGDKFRFESQLQPPLFVADIGNLQQKLSKDPVAGVSLSPTHAAQEPPPAEPKTEVTAAPLAPAREQQRTVTALDVKRYHQLIAIRETQEIVNEYFRRLALDGKLSGIVRCYNVGTRVVVDHTPEHVRRTPGYLEKRIKMLRELDAKGDKYGDEPVTERLPPETDYETGLATRVYPDVNAQDGDGNTALMNAARKGWLLIAEELLRMGADPTRRNHRGDDALSCAKAESNSASLAIKLGAPNAGERKRRAAKVVHLLDTRSLLECARQGDLRRVRFLVEEAGENPNLTNRYGMTALHFAVINRDAAMVQLLAANGGQPEAKNNIGQTPLSMLHSIAHGDKALKALERALQEGVKQSKSTDAKREAAIDQEVKRMEQEQRLAKQLRLYTRGTTAARSIYPTFGVPDRESITRENAQRRLASSVALSRSQQRSQQQSQSDEPTVFQLEQSLTKGQRPDHAAAVKMMGHSLSSPSSDPLAVSWQRHALKYYATTARIQQEKEKRTIVRQQHVASPMARDFPLARMQMPPDRKPPLVLPGETGIDATVRLSDALGKGAGAVMGIAEGVRDEALQQGIPAPDDATFESWMAMRFGNVH
jgi:hypothetical protein